MISERIQKIIDYAGLNAKDFAIRIEVKTSQTIYDLLSGKTKSLSKNVYDKILSCYPEINDVWLLTGKGDMLNHSNSEENRPKVSYTKGVPYYNVDFIGGFDMILNDQTVNPEYLIDFKKYDEATCWCNVTGHSMEPEITHGDIIALKRIDDFSFLLLGEVYAIVTTNGMRTIKRLGPSSNPDNYTLVSANKSPEYGVQELPKRMIRIIYHVLGCMKRL
ncbi:S24 family peptidase [uncultured Bacteroides sp.]|uniref:S24 family peptidase n=1 Tax=uncultured Bacteroides sp. TaxID=162156 RepID=UPI00260DCC59|nr:S24 family peptidase [uncultured Bacteroides sp.]